MKKNKTGWTKRLTAIILGASIAAGVVQSKIFFIRAQADEKVQKSTSASWNAKMQGLYQTLTELITDTSSDRRFGDPKLKSKINTNADKIAKLAHQLGEKATKSPDLDPTLVMIGGILAEEAREAADALKNGNREYARSILRTIPSYCIACHTRNSSGPQFKELALEPTDPSLTPTERGEFFAATRQFDRALGEFDKVIRDQKVASEDHWIWKRTVEQALAVAVRSKNDPKIAEIIVDAVIATKNTPEYIRADAKLWKKSIQAWMKEKPLEVRDEGALRTEAMRLMARAKELQQFMMDRSADIDYLRASAATHDLLQVAKDSRTIADGLFMAGLSYEVLNPLKRDDIHQIYYAACVHKLPHTELSELCYRRYEENVILGYTGSGGTSVPSSVRERMRKLETLSQSIPATPEPRR